MPLMAPALTCVSPAGWLGIKWLSSRGCKDVAGLCPGNQNPRWYLVPTNGDLQEAAACPTARRLVGTSDRGILGVGIVCVKRHYLLRKVSGCFLAPTFLYLNPDAFEIEILRRPQSSTPAKKRIKYRARWVSPFRHHPLNVSYLAGCRMLSLLPVAIRVNEFARNDPIPFSRCWWLAEQISHIIPVKQPSKIMRPGIFQPHRTKEREAFRDSLENPRVRIAAPSESLPADIPIGLRTLPAIRTAYLPPQVNVSCSAKRGR